ncbi:MAG: SAM-dependent methyltransferase [Alistipes sp.]|nr:SAM-dependent methyltransferase [Alistipes sp.]
MKEECLICSAPLIYLETERVMECAICHKMEPSNSCCEQGHYVCNECHTKGIDAIYKLCLDQTSKSPIEIIEKMMAMPFCHMHGPEHHVMVGAALLTAYRNSGGNIELGTALMELMKRGKQVPGGACGFWGACGAGLSSGMFISIISNSTPLTVEPFALAHKMSAMSLNKIAEEGGPRCCKRDSYLSILAAIDFVEANFGIAMQRCDVECRHFGKNNQCIRLRCPFFPKNQANTTFCFTPR